MPDSNSQITSAEFRVSSDITHAKIQSKVAMLSNAGFIIVWTSADGQDSNGYGIYAQKYDSNGIAQGTEFQVNTYTTSNQDNADILALPDGEFVIAWQSLGQDISAYGVYARIYGSNGEPRSTELQISSFDFGNQADCSMVASDRGFIVAYNSDCYGNDCSRGREVYFKKYDNNGNSLSSESRINNNANGFESWPSIVKLINGGFVVTWVSANDQQPNTIYTIYAQRYDSNVIAQGTNFQVNSYTIIGSSLPHIAALANGGFVITWANNNLDGYGHGVSAQRYDSNVIAQGVEFLVNSYTVGDQLSPRVAALANGGFVITWASQGQDSSGWGVYAQRYDSNGVLRGAEFKVNGYTVGDQGYNYIAALANGGFVITWASTSNLDSNGYGIYAQRYDTNGNTISPGAQLVPTPPSEPRSNDNTPSTIGAGDNTIKGTMIGAVGTVVGGAVLAILTFAAKTLHNKYCKSTSDTLQVIESRSPIGIALGHDKIDIVSLNKSNILFDYDDNGTKTKTSWVGAKDAFLIYDHNDNHQVDAAKELVLTEWSKTAKTDFVALKEVFDSNKDNKFDANDAEFSKFMIWQDKNQDGVSQSDELTSLLEAGLIQIDFHTEQTIHDEFFGKQKDMKIAVVLWADGHQTLAYDLMLETLVPDSM